MEKKCIRVPLLEQADEKALELNGARFDVNTVNWPSAFPYAPIVPLIPCW